MRLSVPVSVSRLFGALMLGLTLVATSGCSSPAPPEPPDWTETTTDTTLETTPEATQAAEPLMEWSVPADVVGVWCGGANDAPDGHWTYVFTAEGEVEASNTTSGFSGHVVTQGDVMTFHVDGSDPWQSSWAVGYEEALGVSLLYLDGYSYYPGSCDS
ncbi:hypothetical protein ACFYXF_46200 [Streptomyces sp. NPDC002680]|uniref:hypothetical protein n=1 Tax=Streptomyces sp. NPDC002680 TaxID=3364659 RepID=UPI0036919D43